MQIERTHRSLRVWLILSLLNLLPHVGATAESVPHIQNMSVPVSGAMQILFHCDAPGPFRVQSRASLDPASPWTDIAAAAVTELQTGVYVAFLPKGLEAVAFFRVIN
jgi:hypothetical protein